MFIVYVFFICLTRINFYKELNKTNALDDEYITNYCFKKDVYRKICYKWNKNTVTYNNKLNLMYYNNILDRMIVEYIINKSDYYKQILCIREDVNSVSSYFPILYSNRDVAKKDIFTYDNSWKKPRSYGGARTHEGTDIMYSLNKADVVPIVSISDGVVEKKGWLELGGYRVYIKANSNVYIYYAHLSSYARGITEGTRVYAGQIIGYMGNTGYGKEGTKDIYI